MLCEVGCWFATEMRPVTRAEKTGDVVVDAVTNSICIWNVERVMTSLGCGVSTGDFVIETRTSGVKGNIWFLWSVFEKRAVGVWNRRACMKSDAYGCLVVWG